MEGYNQRFFWNEWAQKYNDELISVHRYGDIKELEKVIYNIIKNLEIKKDENLLDAGCGSGIFTSILKDLTEAKVTGMDFSIKHLEIMQKKYPEINSVNGDITFLPFKNNCFDKVISYSVLQFVENWKKAVEELLRVTKKNGIIFLGDIPDKSKRWKLFLITIKKLFIFLIKPKKLFEKIKYAFGGPKSYWFDIKEIITFIKKRGFNAKIIEQPVNFQWGTESYKYRVDIIITKK